MGILLIMQGEPLPEDDRGRKLAISILAAMYKDHHYFSEEHIIQFSKTSDIIDYQEWEIKEVICSMLKKGVIENVFGEILGLTEKGRKLSKELMKEIEYIENSEYN